MNKFHAEWKETISHTEGDNRLRFLMEEIIEPTLKRNAYYFRCKSRPIKIGICIIIDEVKGYLDGSSTIPGQHLQLFGELAYTFWLLGEKLGTMYEATLQKRVDQFFSGKGYYEDGPPGFRQFEYELQTICRLVEEDIPFRDDPGEGEPDLIVKPEDENFPVEIKLPTSNANTSLNKALGQIGMQPGVIVLCLDTLLAEVANNQKFNEARRIATELLPMLVGQDEVSVLFEFYIYIGGRTESRHGWIGKQPTQPLVVMLNALSGGHSDVSNLEPPMVPFPAGSPAGDDAEGNVESLE